jgi:hypothetical protein
LDPRLALVGILLTSAFAGCIASEAGTEASAAPEVSSGPAEFDDSTGGIQGLVTDEELNPIGKAQAGLKQSDIITTEMMAMTDEAGHFSLSHVPAGTHLLFVQAIGFEATAKKVEVVPGSLVEVNVALTGLPTDEPFHSTDLRKAAVTAAMVKATPSCMYNIGGQGSSAKTCQGNRFGCDPSANCEVHYSKTSGDGKACPYGTCVDTLDDNPEWATIIGETTWASQSAVVGRGFMFDITAPNTTRGTSGAIDQGSPYTFFKMNPKPPLVWRIEPALLQERKIPEKDWCCDWFYRLFGGWCDLESAAGLGNCETTPDVGIANANPATIYMTFFFKEPAPLGWTALPDA